MYRNTYAEINLKNIKNNVKKIISYCNNYEYYFGVVKADSYGHYSNRVVKSIIDGGCNYLCTATLDEALEIRKDFETPILVLGIIPLEYVDICIQNNITIIISNYEYLNSLIKLKKDLSKLKVHIKLNTGMNRLGINNKEELIKTYDLLLKNSIEVEGIFSHIYYALNEKTTNIQFKLYEELLKSIDYKRIKIRHLCASDAMLEYQKLDVTNGCRLGISMYGLQESNKIELDGTFKLISEVIQINEIDNGVVGYNGTYKIDGTGKIAVIPIGYADGFIRKNKGNYVYINNKKYTIVGNICMDMLFVLIDDSVHVGSKVYLIKDNEHLKEISNYLDTIPYEVICLISKRVTRKYVDYE